MKKILIFKDDAYPVYYIVVPTSKDELEQHKLFCDIVKLTDEEIQYVQNVSAAYNEMQEFLEKKWKSITSSGTSKDDSTN